MADKTIQTALCETADWLEAHPDQHTIGALARTDKGDNVTPGTPGATCFCALGVLASVLGIRSDSETEIYNQLSAVLEPIGISNSDVFTANDEDFVDRTRDDLKPDTPKMAAWLREQAKTCLTA